MIPEISCRPRQIVHSLLAGRWRNRSKVPEPTTVLIRAAYAIPPLIDLLLDLLLNLGLDLGRDQERKCDGRVLSIEVVERQENGCRVISMNVYGSNQVLRRSS